MEKTSLKLRRTFDFGVAERLAGLGVSIGSIRGRWASLHKSLVEWSLLKLVPFRTDPGH
jgi:hypothetical protein